MEDRGDVSVLSIKEPQEWVFTDSYRMEAFYSRLVKVRTQEKKVLVIHIAPTVLSPARVDAFVEHLKTNPEAGHKLRSVQHHTRMLLEFFLEMKSIVITTASGPIDFNMLGLFLLADYRICSDQVQFVNRVLDHEFPPGSASLWFLVRYLGLGRMNRILMEEESLSATQAHELGLVNAVVPEDQLMAKTETEIERFASKPLAAIRSLKKACDHIDSDLFGYLDHVGAGFSENAG